MGAHILATLLAIFCAVQGTFAQELRLAQTVPLPGVNGRIDHMAVDIPGHRLFVCALGNNTVEIIDFKDGKRIHTIDGLGSPQGVGYAPVNNHLLVANDDAGVCYIYDGGSYAKTCTVDYKDDADNVRFDNETKRFYVGYGKGALGIVDSADGRKLGDIPLAGHPEAFQLERAGQWIFVNIPGARQVSVVDRAQGKVIATWSMGLMLANFPMALDEGHHRLFVGCRMPAKLVVLDTESGKEIASEAIGGDTDDLFYDAKRKLIYAVCGEGNISVIQQLDADHYRGVKQISTAPGARTGFFVPELDSLFVAVPHRGGQQAEIREYKIQSLQ